MKFYIACLKKWGNASNSSYLECLKINLINRILFMEDTRRSTYGGVRNYGQCTRMIGCHKQRLQCAKPAYFSIVQLFKHVFNVSFCTNGWLSAFTLSKQNSVCTFLRGCNAQFRKTLLIFLYFSFEKLITNRKYAFFCIYYVRLSPDNQKSYPFDDN